MKKALQLLDRHKFKVALLVLLLITVLLIFDDETIVGSSPPLLPTATLRVDSLTLAPFGKLHVYLPAGTPQSVTLMISGDGGWKFGVLGFAKTFAQEGSLVVGVDILQYYKSLRASGEPCYHIAADFMQLAAQIEKRYGLNEYQKPFLMGYSSGATLVYALLAQARPGTFSGGISLGFCPDVGLPKKFCELNGLTEESLAKGFDLRPDLQLGNRWVVLHGKLDLVCNFQTTEDFISKTSDAEFVPLDKVGHGFSNPADFMPQWKQSYRSLLASASKTETERLSQLPVAQYPGKTAADLNKLPLDVTEPKTIRKDAPFAIFLSGDGGWYSFEQKVSDRMAVEGLPTVGLDTKSYFWNRKTPQQSAQDLTGVMDAFCEKWQKEKVVLIGYSMGAEVLPFIVNQLPADKQAMLKEVVLLSPGVNCDFEVHIANMLGFGSGSNTYQVLPELQKMPAGLREHTLLITGDKEQNPLPAQLKNDRVNTATVPGDHHYNNNSLAVFEVLKRKGVI